MFDYLYQHIKSKVDISEEEWSIITSLFIPKKVRRKHFLLQAGDVSEYMFFVNKGCLRSYTVDEKGDEHIVQFAIEGWWIGDMNSFLTGEEATFNVDALEDSEVLLLDYNAQEQLYQQINKFERYMRLLLQSNYIAMHRRLVSTISTTAEDKYLRMVKKYPDIVQRVPQHMIASYLGLKPETLSRVRKKLSTEK